MASLAKTGHAVLYYECVHTHAHLVSYCFRYSRPYESGQGCSCVGDPHQHSRVARGNVQVVDAESGQSPALKSNGHSEQGHGSERGGAKIAAQEQEN